MKYLSREYVYDGIGGFILNQTEKSNRNHLKEERKPMKNWTAKISTKEWKRIKMIKKQQKNSIVLI